jgi:dihydroorotate dehydrogenase
LSQGSHRLYRFFFSSFLRRLDPETAHHLGAFVIKVAGFPAIRQFVRLFTIRQKTLSISALGLKFSTPFGMAAGFDKDVTMVRGLYALGFGHVEVGTITALAQKGNPKPRLFRLVPDEALINRMGFNNKGAEHAQKKLKRLYNSKHRPIIGVNIGKSRVVAVEDAIGDYLTSTRLLAPYSDYLVVNVSSPNTPGLRGLQELDNLKPLLQAVKAEAGNKPLLVKIAPDLTTDQVEAITRLSISLQLQGIIATNTTISREGLITSPQTIETMGAGGLSGKPLAQRSIDVLKIIRQIAPSDFCIISVGGVNTAEDVHSRLEAGATLVQGYTGFVYYGPFWASEMNKHLTQG